EPRRRRQLRRQGAAGGERLVRGIGYDRRRNGHACWYRFHHRWRLVDGAGPGHAQQLRVHRQVPEERRHPGQQPLHLPQDGWCQRGCQPERWPSAGRQLQLDHQEQLDDRTEPEWWGTVPDQRRLQVDLHRQKQRDCGQPDKRRGIQPGRQPPVPGRRHRPRRAGIILQHHTGHLRDPGVGQQRHLLPVGYYGSPAGTGGRQHSSAPV
ncbi:MAG: hypothetical protein AVDCRST_MAG24-1485, partial [uncultured Nocardioidaceae bacterium]